MQFTTIVSLLAVVGVALAAPAPASEGVRGPSLTAFSSLNNTLCLYTNDEPGLDWGSYGKTYRLKMDQD